MQLPLEKGDLLFFNPALFHAAGSNTTKELHRCANLLQISSAFGAPMETVARDRMSLACYETLLNLVQQNHVSSQELSHVIAATADGYAFPTNLDNDQPVDGLAPQTMQELMSESIHNQKTVHEFEHDLMLLMVRKQA